MQSILHINDNNLLLQGAADVKRSQGYVWIKGDQLVFDKQGDLSAVKHCRLHPQQINNRYWQQCDQSSIPKNDAGMRHAADLIWQHLAEFQKGGVSELSLIVPSHYQSENLQLLLGIAKATRLKINALVNKAVLATQLHISDAGKFCHIDVQLHQTVVSWLEINDGQLSLADVEVIQDVGIHLMEEALLKSLQANFIQNDRFDPLHDAAYEQQLFDQLPSLASKLIDKGKTTVTVQGNGHAHSVGYEASEFNLVLQSFFDRLLGVKAQAKTAFIDFNAAFQDAIPAAIADSGFKHLSSNALPKDSAFMRTSSGENLVYQTEMSLNGVVAPITKEPIKAAPKLAGALHLVLAGKAVAIDHAHLDLAAGELKLSYAKVGNAMSLIESGQLTVLGDDGRKQLRANDRLGSALVDGVLSVIQVIGS